MALPTLRRILNDTPGSATDIDYDFQTLQTHINSEVIVRDGSVAMTSPLTGVAAVSANQYATLAQAQSAVPTGSIWDYAGDTAPSGWALCDGSVQSITDPDYAALYAVIGVKFGDPGGGNFNLPDLQGKVTVGVEPGGDTAYDTIGGTGGQRDAELLEHIHDIAHTHTHTFSINTTGSTHDHTTSGGAHDHTYSSVFSNATATLGGGAFYNNVSTVNTGGTGSHSHTITTTGSSHIHGISGSITATTDDSQTAGSGTTLVDKNFQPYVVVNKMIKL